MTYNPTRNLYADAISAQLRRQREQDARFIPGLTAPLHRRIKNLHPFFLGVRIARERRPQ
ncbi:hypothetical protein AB0G79_20270 [Streptomyces sp. NPDC020807]|uniref:hypothetical protein n=1 Tax=Streptomyces sp. NPDC020807 TaxID=3155119 RepID=UPI0033E61F5D